MNARGKKRRKLFHIFSGQGRREFLAGSAARCDGSKEIFDERSSGGTSKNMFQGVGDLDEKISGEEMELLERNRILEE